MKTYFVIMSSILAGISAGCTSISVKPLDAAYKVKHICIRENPKVIVEDFIDVVTNGFNRHHISTEVIPSPVKLSELEMENQDDLSDEYYMHITPVPESCDFSIIYSARRSWDIVSYLSSATISIYDKNHAIANADYHLVGKGGLSLLKWQGVKTKIDPVMDELLLFYK